MNETTLNLAMYKYYQVYPKYEMQDFAVYYCLEDMAEESKLELEIILGIPLKFEIKDREELNTLLQETENRDFILQN